VAAWRHARTSQIGLAVPWPPRQREQGLSYPIIDLAYAYSFCRQDSPTVTRPKTTIRTACHAKRGNRRLARR
jgi:hypothetical protein